MYKIVKNQNYLGNPLSEGSTFGGFNNVEINCFDSTERAKSGTVEKSIINILFNLKIRFAFIFISSTMNSDWFSGIISNSKFQHSKLNEMKTFIT